MDPREDIIEERLKNIRRIIAVSGGKGGIGKSLISSVLALNLSEMGFKVGLLDLDFTSPSTHIILGVDKTYPEEKNGIIPPKIHGIEYMSLVFYTEDKPSPLRGFDISNALIELLAITIWGQLDFLVIDMPPGIGDIMLDIIRLMKKCEFLLVTTPSKVTMETVEKLMGVLKENKVPTLGLIENMKMENSPKFQLKKYGVPMLGEIMFDRSIEDSIGEPEKLLKTNFSKSLGNILNQIAQSPQNYTRGKL